jgi:hypothetical protein
MRRLIFIVTLVLLPCFAHAQFKTQTKSGDLASTLRNPFGIGKTAISLLGLDPNRLDISHSYQMGYMSIGNQGYTQGMYLNTLTYQFKIPLTLAFQWGIAFQPNFGIGNSSILQNGPFVSGAQLRYQPSNKFTIEIDYQRLPYNSLYYYQHRFEQ